MRKLGIGFGWSIAAIALSMAGCDNRTGDDDSGVTLFDSGPRDAGPRDAGGPVDAGRDGGGTSCGPAGGACLITDPTSCGTGMGCQLQSPDGTTWTTACFTSGTGTDGTACMPGMAGQCSEGFGCLPSESVCRQWCCTAADCDVAGQRCNLFAGANAGICVTPATCDLVAQTGCDPGEECNVLDPATMSLVCDPAGTATEGQSCAARNACVAGLTCVDDPGVCRAYCDMAAATPCPTERMCVNLTGAPTGIGVCVPTTP